MASTTEIAWCDASFNPWIGCTKVAPGCKSCYAEAYAKRYGKADWGPNGTRVKTSENYWRQPLKWNREAEAAGERKRVFCASLADVFEDWQGQIVGAKGFQIYRHRDGCLQHFDGHPPIGAFGWDLFKPLAMEDLRRDLFSLIDATPWLDWLLLTKRPENIRRMWVPTCAKCSDRGWYLKQFADNHPTPCDECDRKARELGLPLQNGQYARPTGFRFNTWLLTSVSEQESYDRNAAELEKCRDLAPVLGLSAEPLLGPIVITGRVDWVIVGCESNGKKVGSLGAFRDEVHWRDAACQIQEQCEAAGVAYFAKQIPINGLVSHDLADWPPLMRVRDFPMVEAVR